MSFTVLLGAVEQGFIYSLVALGLFLSYRTLDVADLTTDGSFTLGAACSAVLTIQGQPVAGLLLALAAGALAGLVTALLQTRLGVQPILAGIVTMTGLYTVNLMVMGGRSNLNMLREQNVFTAAEAALGPMGKLLLAGMVAVVAAVLLALFLRTRLGLSIRATGDNRDMVRASSVDTAFTITVGLSFANALTGLSGAVVGQYQRTVDMNSGTGIVVIGLACLIVGETVVGRRGVGRGVVAVVVGSIIYRFIYAVVFYTKVVPVDCLKLLTAAVVALAIAAPTIKSGALFEKRRLSAGRKGGR